MGFLFRRHDDREICARCIGKKLLPPKRLSHKHGDFSYLFIYLFIYFLFPFKSVFMVPYRHFFFHFYSFFFYLNCVAHIYYVLQEKKKIT